MLPDIALTSIEAAHLQQLIDNGTRENRRLDFKLTLALATREERVEFLRDVVAMANADGGTIVYGVQEGEGDDAGVAVALPGLELNVDETSNLIDSLTRDNIDERVTVLQHDVKLPSGRLAYLVRIPASPLAPHMLANLRTAPARFYARANTSNEPMTARQIKEAALRHGAAVERAAARIHERIAALRLAAQTRKQLFGDNPAPPDQAILHFVPLFPAAGGWNYGDPRRADRLRQVSAFGYDQPYDQLHFTQHGAFQRFPRLRHTGFLRDGSLEFQQYDVVRPPELQSPLPVVIASDLEEAISLAFQNARALSADGLLPTPMLIQLHLLSVGGARLKGSRRWDSGGRESALEEADVITDAFVLTDWEESDRVLHDLLDHFWQAWGYDSCRHLYNDGTLMHFDSEGNGIPKPSEPA